MDGKGEEKEMRRGKSRRMEKDNMVDGREEGRGE